MRIDYGYRCWLFFVSRGKDGGDPIVGGDKRRQPRDIAHAIE
jgi:hypothetical protein